MSFNPETQKIQYAFYGINGELYKQGFVSSYRRLWTSHKRHSQKYGWSLTIKTLIVDKAQKSFIPTEQKIGSAYCFCPNTPIFVSKCPDCGKSPYTD